MSYYKYFMLPADNVPTNPDYPLWFSTWSNEQMNLTWSTEPPAAGAPLPTWVIGRIEDSPPPKEATMVWTGGTKCIPPPPMALSTPPSLSEFETKFAQLLMTKGM